MIMEQNFLDNLDGSWGETIASTYEKIGERLIYKCGEYSISKRTADSVNDSRIYSDLDKADNEMIINLECLLLFDDNFTTNAFTLIPYTDESIDLDLIEINNPTGMVEISCRLNDAGQPIGIEKLEAWLNNMEVYKYSTEDHDDDGSDIDLLHTNNIYFNGNSIEMETKAYLNPSFFIDLLDLKYNKLIEKYPEYSNSFPLILNEAKQKLTVAIEKSNKLYNEK